MLRKERRKTFFFPRFVSALLTTSLTLGPSSVYALRPTGVEEANPQLKQEIQQALGISAGVEEEKELQRKIEITVSTDQQAKDLGLDELRSQTERLRQLKETNRGGWQPLGLYVSMNEGWWFSISRIQRLLDGYYSSTRPGFVVLLLGSSRANLPEGAIARYAGDTIFVSKEVRVGEAVYAVVHELWHGKIRDEPSGPPKEFVLKEEEAHRAEFRVQNDHLDLIATLRTIAQEIGPETSAGKYLSDVADKMEVDVLSSRQFTVSLLPHTLILRQYREEVDPYLEGAVEAYLKERRPPQVDQDFYQQLLTLIGSVDRPSERLQGVLREAIFERYFLPVEREVEMALRLGPQTQEEMQQIKIALAEQEVARSKLTSLVEADDKELKLKLAEFIPEVSHGDPTQLQPFLELVRMAPQPLRTHLLLTTGILIVAGQPTAQKSAAMALAWYWTRASIKDEGGLNRMVEQLLRVLTQIESSQSYAYAIIEERALLRNDDVSAGAFSLLEVLVKSGDPKALEVLKELATYGAISTYDPEKSAPGLPENQKEHLKKEHAEHNASIRKIRGTARHVLVRCQEAVGGKTAGEIEAFLGRITQEEAMPLPAQEAKELSRMIESLVAEQAASKDALARIPPLPKEIHLGVLRAIGMPEVLIQVIESYLDPGVKVVDRPGDVTSPEGLESVFLKNLSGFSRRALPSENTRSSGLEEERVLKALSESAKAVQGPGILVIEAAVLGQRLGLEEFVARVPKELTRRIVLFGEGSIVSQEVAVRNRIRYVNSNDILDLAVTLAGMEEALQISLLGGAATADMLSRLLPRSMPIFHIPAQSGLEQILRAFGISKNILDQINASGLEEQFARLRAA